ncbi:MAG: tetratricopeptide repeat protein [Candidatus Melainabacteria bacterium]|mgnify:CR=1 FL=1|nr:tetratricopeptide repeat protein [Candidatus Melainabacteria bacterium]
MTRNRAKLTPWLGAASIANILVAVTISLTSANAAESTESWSALLAQGDSAIAAQSPSIAEQRYRQALELVKKTSKDQDEIDKCSLKLASALTLLNRTPEARSILQQMLQRLEKKHGAASSKLSAVLMGLGAIEESAGDHTLAITYYNRCLQISEKNYGVYSPDAAIALHGIGRVHNKMGNRTAANESYKRAITILSKDSNLEAADQLKRVMHDYGDMMKGTDRSDRDLINDFQKDIFNKKNTDAAPPKGSHSGSTTSPLNSTSTGQSQWQQQSEQQLSTARTADTNENERVSLRGIHMPASDVALKPAFQVVSDTIFNQSRYHLGEAQYQRMIASDVDSLGPNHPSVANDFNGLAQLYIAQKKYPEARQCLVRALAIYESTYQSRNVLTINTVASLAFVEANLGHIAEATRLYREALSNAQETLGPNSLETAKILNGLAFLYYQQGQLAKASTFYEWAIASTEQAVGTKDPLLAACLKDYAQVLRGLDNNSKASEVEQRAGQILSQ